MSNSILTQESTVGDLFAAARSIGEGPGLMLAMLDHTPAWAFTFDAEIVEGRKTVTFSREVGTVEIRQSFYFDTWEPAAEGEAPVVAFYSYQDARDNGWPKPEVLDVFRAVDILQACGEWQPEAAS